ncbi:hypothetical protein ACTXT7_008514 [Hymenolepis weldensis]
MVEYQKSLASVDFLNQGAHCLLNGRSTTLRSKIQISWLLSWLCEYMPLFQNWSENGNINTGTFCGCEPPPYSHFSALFHICMHLLFDLLASSTFELKNLCLNGKLCIYKTCHILNNPHDSHFSLADINGAFEFKLLLKDGRELFFSSFLHNTDLLRLTQQPTNSQ